MTDKPLRLDQKLNLILIGYRATGKTSVGARLAQILGRPFVDLDQVLVQEAGKSIAEIVAQEGWEEFRRREKELVARYGPAQGLVLATGGGVVVDFENVQTLRQNGLVIWLTADPATIQARLAADKPQKQSRPSLTGNDTIKEVAEVLKSRQHLYLAAAQMVIDTADMSVTQVVEQILATLNAKEGAPHGG